MRILFALILAVVFGLGVFLAISADEMPAPGLLLIGIAVIVAAVDWHKRKSRRLSTRRSHDPFEATERDRETYEIEAERRRRGDSETTYNPSDSNASKLD